MGENENSNENSPLKAEETHMVRSCVIHALKPPPNSR